MTVVCDPVLKEDRIAGYVFGWSMLASGIAALSAKERGDETLGKQTRRILIEEITGKGGFDGFVPECYLDDKHRVCGEASCKSEC